MKWETYTESHYLWDDGELVASLQHLTPERDNHPHERWAVQIHTTDGGIVTPGYISAIDFKARGAHHLAELALAENQPYDWWMENGATWWESNKIGGGAL